MGVCPAAAKSMRVRGSIRIPAWSVPPEPRGWPTPVPIRKPHAIASGEWRNSSLGHRVTGDRRKGANLSAYGLAEWLVRSWWRLRWEPTDEISAREGWRDAHDLAGIGGGWLCSGRTSRYIMSPPQPASYSPARFVARTIGDRSGLRSVSRTPVRCLKQDFPHDFSFQGTRAQKSTTNQDIFFDESSAAQVRRSPLSRDAPRTPASAVRPDGGTRLRMAYRPPHGAPGFNASFRRSGCPPLRPSRSSSEAAQSPHSSR